MKNFKSNKITFFYNNKHEKYIFDPISEIFRQKKINFTFSKNHYLKSDIGFYIRKPKEISLSLGASCELPIHCHQEIVDMTVSSILEGISDPRYKSHQLEVSKNE